MQPPASADISVAFSRVHALLMLASAGVSLAGRSAWPAAVAGAVSLSACLFLYRGRWTPGGRFGGANRADVGPPRCDRQARAVCFRPPGPAAALLVLAVFALDGVDGWLARRRGQASAFGALLRHGVRRAVRAVVLAAPVPARAAGRVHAARGLLALRLRAAVLVLPQAAVEAPRSRSGATRSR